jgi:hypothetical protein
MDGSMDSLFGSLSVRDITALTALLLTIITIYFSRQHNKLSVKPLMCDGSNIDRVNLTFEYFFQNKGLGTAKILRFRYFCNGECVSASGFKKIIKEKTNRLCVESFVNLGEGYAIAKDENISIITLEFKKGGESEKCFLDVMNFLVSNCKIEIQFESLYGEKDSFSTSLSAIDLNEFNHETK